MTGSGALYDEDILLWSEQQAAALRALKRRRDLPNELDLDNVVEEIETVGRSELSATHNFIRLIFLHLIKAALEPDSDARGYWMGEIVGFRSQLRRTFVPSMRPRLDLDEAWTEALAQAAKSAQLEPGRGASRHPLGLDELLDAGLEPETFVPRISKALGRGRTAGA